MPRHKDDYFKKRNELRKRKEKRKDKSIGWDKVNRRDESIPIDSGHSDPRTAPPKTVEPLKPKAPPPPKTKAQRRKAAQVNPPNSNNPAPKKKKGCGRGIFFLIMVGGGIFAAVRYANKPVDEIDWDDWMDDDSSVEVVEGSIDLTGLDADGETLFNVGCAACHTTTNEDFIGPGLGDISGSRDAHWIYAFLKNPDRKKESDYDAEMLDYEYPNADQPAISLSFKQLEAILDYIDSPEAEWEDEPDTLSSTSDLMDRLGG